MRRQAFITALGVTSAILLLAGCASGPPRGENGQVTEQAVISAQALLTGDCFTFNSLDGTIVSEVTVMPCTDAHDYVVTDQGVLAEAAIDAAGSLQNAVSAACKEAFDAFKEKNTADTRPAQEFMVFDAPGAEGDKAYSCISTDPSQAGL